MKNQSKLLVIFTILLIAIPLISSVWWNPFTWFNEDTGETIEYETPYNETIEEPILENNSVKKDFTLNVLASDSGNLSSFVDDGSLVSWWRMDDVEETKLVDYTGRNNGTIYGATQTTGIKGKALSFDGVDDYVNGGSLGMVRYNNSFSCWIKPNDISATQVIFWESSSGMSLGFYTNGVVLRSDAKKRWYTNDGLTNGIWSHIAVNYDTDGQPTLYINGVESSTLNSGNQYFTGGGNFYLGKRLSGNPYKGELDELMIFNRSLSAEEIQSLYTNTTVPTITINSPENITYTESPDVLINITATNDLYIDSIWYDFGEGNTTYTTPFIETFDSGNYTLIAYVNDTYGNLNSTNVSFVVDIGCIESLVNTTKSDWINTTCSLDQMNQSQFWTEYDENNCGTFENVTYYDYQLVGPTYVNSSWNPWINLDCLPTDFYNQSRNLTSTDIYGCANTLTFFEYRDDEDVCDFCTPNLVNTSKTRWVDTTSCIDGLVNQSRNWTQYDYNDCGEVANETFFEYRTTSCGGTVLTAPTISLLNCRIPNTNPLCLFYYFGMSLISKNIILINGGILNII